MRSKHLLPLGIALSLALLTVAINTYPGGNQIDANSIGFDLKQNYLCNLFGKTAVNGARNSARIWAITGWFILCASFACFFIRFSKNIAVQGASRIIRYCGILGTTAAFLVVTPLHNAAITLTLVFLMISALYISIFIFRSKMTWLKILAILLFVIAYATAAVFYTSFHLEILPSLQKATLVAFLTWVLSLQYFTTKADFAASSPLEKL
ncbi:MAG TPA: hypothetical protein VG101_16930 [Puia sp.]|nr:hypothetical protein [Puia sp.]